MRAFKSRLFNRWAAKVGLTDAMLWAALEEMERGLVDADLGGHVYKKRIALGGRGKSGGARTLIVYRAAEIAFFVDGFTKAERDNIGPDELEVLRATARDLLGYSEQGLRTLIETGKYLEVKRDGR